MKSSRPLPEHPLEQPVGAAVGVVGHHHVVAGLQQRHHRARGRQARREREGLPARLDRGDVPFEGGARRVVRAPVLVALVHAQRVLDVGGGLINRSDNGAGGWIGHLSRVDAHGIESGGVAQFHNASDRISPGCSDGLAAWLTRPR